LSSIADLSADAIVLVVRPEGLFPAASDDHSDQRPKYRRGAGRPACCCCRSIRSSQAHLHPDTVHPHRDLLRSPPPASPHDGYGGMMSFGHAAYSASAAIVGISAFEGIGSGFIQWPVALADRRCSRS